MAKGPKGRLTAALLLALSSPVAAGSPRLHPPAPPRAPAARRPASPTPVAADPERPSFLSRAVTAVRLFDLHRGRDAFDPAATARERGTEAP